MSTSPFAALARPWARFARHRGARVGGVILFALVVFSLLGPLALPFEADQSDFVHGFDALGLPVGPTAQHWLGTDALFRDLLARLAAGGRLSLAIAFSATLLSTTIGAAVGILSGYVAGSKLGWIDTLLMRLVDILLSIPYLLLVMAIGAALDRTTPSTVLLILGVTSWLGTARLVRAKTLQVREIGYVEAARALGQRAHVILVRHLLPNVAGTLLVTATTSMATMILAESVLSYLQVGIAPPTATWGRMLNEGQRALSETPRLVIAPGLVILVSVLGFNLIGEGLRDSLDARDT